MNVFTKSLLILAVMFCYLQVQAETKDIYQQPTFIGADIKAQKALLATLSAKPELNDQEQRQLLLVQLAVLANSEDKTLKQLEQLEAQIKNYLKTHKNDAELLTASGSVISLQSLFYQDNLGKMNFLSRKGMRVMDRAVKKHPNHLGARLLRGLSYANMPAFLNRAGFAKTDLELVRQHIPQDPNNRFIGFVDHYLAMAVSKLEEGK